MEICARLGDRRIEARLLAGMGTVNKELGRSERARTYFVRSLALSRQTGFKRQEVSVLEQLGRTGMEQGRWTRAAEYFDRALALSREIEFPFGESRALFNLARLDLAAGDVDQARLSVEAALNITRELRGNVASHALRISYSESVRELQQFYIDLLMRLHIERPGNGFEALAFEAYERARARSMRERLSEPNGLADMPFEPFENDGLRVRQLQAALGDEALLLAYHLGEKRSFLWTISAQSLSVHVLPPERELAPRAREAYELLSPPTKKIGETAMQYHNRQRVRESQFSAIASSLSRSLLAPAVSELVDRRLVIVGDGALHYLPFSALPAPGSVPPVPLIVLHEIVRLPSATILPLLHRRSRSRAPPRKTLAVIADPVFDRGDPRLGSSALPIRRSRAELRDFPFAESAIVPRLLASRQEAKEILELVPREERLQALGFDANRALATSGVLGSYRTVHFATHGIMNGKHPDSSGIILSLVDERGNPDDGFLALGDIYELDLPVGLVVLSACSTAMGKETRAEGLIGLTRGFLLAGASSVIASYWNVDDEATAVFMTRFYRNMFSNASNASGALRATQISMLRDKRWRSPRYWAAFEFHGQWT